MSDEDHVATARAVYDRAAPRYVQFVGTEISSATEGPIDRSLLAAFVELIKRQTIVGSPMLGAGQAGPQHSWRNVASMSSAWMYRRQCSPSLGPHIRTSSSKRVNSMHSDRNGSARGCCVLVLDHLHTSGSTRRGLPRTGEGLDPGGLLAPCFSGGG